MKLIDPHLDVASIYDEFHLSLSDFFSSRSDVPITLPMLQQSETAVAGFSLFFDPSLVKTTMFDGVMQYYDFYQSILSQTDDLALLRTSGDVTRIPEGKIGFFYSVEGLECLRNLSDFEHFYSLGVRSFGLTWSDANEYATGNGAPTDDGITSKGKELLRIMNQHRLLVDTAHLSPQSFIDLDQNFDGIIINTHANARSIVDLRHNLTDDQIQIIVDHDGIVCLFPIKEEVGGQGTFDDWYVHLDYIASKWGSDRVGICSDIFPLPEYPFVNDAQNMLILKDFQNFLLQKMDAQMVQKITHANFRNLLVRAL